MNIKLRLREVLLKEIGDSEGLPFELKRSTINTSSKHIFRMYEFTVPKENGQSYTIEVTNNSYPTDDTTENILNNLGVERLENGIYLYVSFELMDSVNQYGVINKGDAFKILTTVKSIVLDTIEQCEAKGFELMMIYSLPVAKGKVYYKYDDNNERKPYFRNKKGEELEYKGDINNNIRKNMYDYLYKKFKRKDFELFDSGRYSGIYNKVKSENLKDNEPEPQQPEDNLSQLDIDRIINKINELLSEPRCKLNKTIEPSIAGNDVTFDDIKLSYFFRHGNVDFYPIDEKSLNFIIQNESRLVNLVG